MSRLLFIRHAKTDLAGTFCGYSDPPVNTSGCEQIRDLVARLGSERIDAIYSSDLRRATTTARALGNRFQIPVKTSHRLREIYFGDWEGLTWAQIEAIDPLFARRWSEAFPALPTPGGETYAVFQERVLDEVGRLVHIGEDELIAVVTHGGVMRVVLQELFGYSRERTWELTDPYCCSFLFAGNITARSVSQ